MEWEVVPHQSPEDREYARYVWEIEVRKQRVAQLQADSAAFKEQLGRFSAEYHSRIGVLFVELDRIELAISDYEFRTAQLRADPQIEPEELERQARHKFANQREQIEDDEEEARHYEREHRQDQTHPVLDDASTAVLRRLYRELVKRFHPDLSKTEDERLQREMVMKKVNAAFHERDIQRLQVIALEYQVDESAFESKSIGEKLVWAIREISRLDVIIASLLEERRELESTELSVLWTHHQADENVFERLEQGLAYRIKMKREQLQTLINEFRTVVDEVHHA